MWCHNCGAEYRPGFTVCSDCDLPLYLTPPPEPSHEVRAANADREHPNNDVRTAILGQWNPFEAEIVLEILHEAGIFAMTKRSNEEPEHYVYTRMAEAEAGTVLVDASRVDEARALVDQQLPVHLRSVEESMRALEDPSPGPETPWGPGWGRPNGN